VCEWLGWWGGGGGGGGGVAVMVNTVANGVLLLP